MIVVSIKRVYPWCADGDAGTGTVHGARDLVEKARERREWKHLKTYYYTNGKERKI